MKHPASRMFSRLSDGVAFIVLIVAVYYIWIFNPKAPLPNTHAQHKRPQVSTTVQPQAPVVSKAPIQNPIDAIKALLADQLDHHDQPKSNQKPTASSLVKKLLAPTAEKIETEAAPASWFDSLTTKLQPARDTVQDEAKKQYTEFSGSTDQASQSGPSLQLFASDENPFESFLVDTSKVKYAAPVISTNNDNLLSSWVKQLLPKQDMPVQNTLQSTIDAFSLYLNKRHPSHDAPRSLAESVAEFWKAKQVETPVRTMMTQVLQHILQHKPNEHKQVRLDTLRASISEYISKLNHASEQKQQQSGGIFAAKKEQPKGGLGSIFVDSNADSFLSSFLAQPKDTEANRDSFGSIGASSWSLKDFLAKPNHQARTETSVNEKTQNLNNRVAHSQEHQQAKQGYDFASLLPKIEKLDLFVDNEANSFFSQFLAPQSGHVEPQAHSKAEQRVNHVVGQKQQSSEPAPSKGSEQNGFRLSDIFVGDFGDAFADILAQDTTGSDARNPPVEQQQVQTTNATPQKEAEPKKSTTAASKPLLDGILVENDLSDTLGSVLASGELGEPEALKLKVVQLLLQYLSGARKDNEKPAQKHDQIQIPESVSSPVVKKTCECS